MTQAEIDRAVARATGESLCTVSGRGFSLAAPELLDYDPEPSEIEDLIIDWDALDVRRRAQMAAA